MGSLSRFLLAALQIDQICLARTVKQIKNRLNSMPREIDSLYRETVDRIKKQPGDDGNLGMRILGWMTHTRRPLTVDELRYGLAVEYDEADEAAEEAKILDYDNILPAQSLVDVCAGLVMINPQSQVVRLVHYTAQEFFDKERSDLFGDTDADMAQACLTYLCYDTNIVDGTMTSLELRILLEILLTHPFLDYASTFWLSHVHSRHTRLDSSPTFPKAAAYIKDSGRLQFCATIWDALSAKSRPYARSDSLIQLSTALLETASKWGHLDFVKILLDLRSWSTGTLEGALHSASSRGYVEIAKLLCKHGASVSSWAHDGSSALHKACRAGHGGVARALLENNWSLLNARDRWMWTPLHYAARYGTSQVVEYLVSLGLDIEAQTPLGLTACHLAAARGDIQSLKSLMYVGQPDSIISNRTKKGRTPLHFAAESGHLEVARILLRAGADPMARDEKGYTPLVLALASNPTELREIFDPYEQAALNRPAEFSITKDHVVPSEKKEVDDLDFASNAAPIESQGISVPLIRLVPPTPELEGSLRSEYFSSKGT